MIPMILQEMTSHGWMTAEDLSRLIGIAEMTPGPLGINCATFAGTQTAGIAGGMAAVCGVLMPTFLLALPAAIFMRKFRESTFMGRLMQVIKPICVAMTIQAAVILGRQNFFSEAGDLDLSAVLIGAIGFYLIHFRKWPVSRVLVCAAVLGMICFGVL